LLMTVMILPNEFRSWWTKSQSLILLKNVCRRGCNVSTSPPSRLLSLL
jgi:hypothetical protein